MRYKSTSAISFLGLCVLSTIAHDDGIYPADEIIEMVNSAQIFWQAGYNFPLGTTESSVRRLLGYRGNSKGRIKTLPVRDGYDSIKDEDVPESFDARKKWPKCSEIIGHIRNQGFCGSCWAVSSTSALTDRFCIKTKGKHKIPLSAQQLVSCCLACGDGCNGGYDDEAWKYFSEHGVVTGGDYCSNTGCQPYEIPPTLTSDKNQDDPTPICHLECTNKLYKKSFKKDHYKTVCSYSVPSNVMKIQKEIVANGPVQAGFTVFQDFFSYKNGVYQYVCGEPLGGHAVKIIGWGSSVSENTTVPYWLVANSWGTQWGDNGFFKIKLGTDECGIESELFAGIPKVGKKHY